MRNRSRGPDAPLRTNSLPDERRNATIFGVRTVIIFVAISPFEKIQATAHAILRHLPPRTSPELTSAGIVSIENATCAKNEVIFPTTVRKGEVAKDNPSVKNRLLSSYEFWENTICAPFYVLSIIKNGYAIPFVANPPPCYAKNNRSSLRHQDFVDSGIRNYLEKSYI